MWHHRQWLLSCIRANHDIMMPETLSTAELQIWGTHTTFEAELAISSGACEIYPRNYFAWAHRWFCVNELVSFAATKKSLPAAANAISKDIDATKRWLEAHVSDASAVHHLISVFQLASTIIDTKTRSDIQLHALSLVKSFPEHETMWLYLRATFQLQGDSPELQKFLCEVAHPWASQTLSCSGHDEETVSKFAFRFIAQRSFQVRLLFLSNRRR